MCKFSVLYSVGDDSDKLRHFMDKDICHPFFLGICMNALFTNTVSLLNSFNDLPTSTVFP